MSVVMYEILALGQRQLLEWPSANPDGGIDIPELDQDGDALCHM